MPASGAVEDSAQIAWSRHIETNKQMSQQARALRTIATVHASAKRHQAEGRDSAKQRRHRCRLVLIYTSFTGDSDLVSLWTSFPKDGPFDLESKWSGKRIWLRAFCAQVPREQDTQHPKSRGSPSSERSEGRLEPSALKSQKIEIRSTQRPKVGGKVQFSLTERSAEASSGIKGRS